MLRLFGLAFWCFGVLIVIIGANQAPLATALDLDLAESGLLGAALALGALGGVTGAGPLYDRFAPRPLFIGAALLAAGALGSVHAEMTYFGAVVRVGLAGLGAGAYNTITNASVTERFGREAGRPMALIHGIATVGAATGAPLCGWLAQRDWSLSFKLLGAAHLLLVAAALATAWPKRVAIATSPTADSDPPLAWRKLLPFVVISFGYVGLEASLTIFAVPYATDGLGLSEARGQYGISAFWLGILLSRGTLFFVPNATARAMRNAGLVATAFIVLGATLPFGSVIALHVGAGACIGFTYPLLMVLLGQQYGKARGTAQGLAGGAGALGGTCAPWITGVLGDRFGISVAIAALAAWSSAIALAAASIVRQARLAKLRQNASARRNSG